ncbi:MAG: HEAT repeat domain-containing protein [Planctomycetes bacterium]|nr:HEAT repeat domain-containing protein [Planctomycetota bacterium]
MAIVLLLLSALLRDEAALRDAFAKEIKAKEPAKRVEALKKLAGAKEEKSIDLLVHSLKDSALEVRKAAAEAIEGSSDGGGKAIKTLGEILVDKKEDLGLRMACAKALVKSPYKFEVFPYLLKAIASIEADERQFHKFGFDVTKLIDGYTGKSFNADKTTAERWEEWWNDNKAALQKEDEKLKEEWKKKKE